MFTFFDMMPFCVETDSSSIGVAVLARSDLTHAWVPVGRTISYQILPSASFDLATTDGLMVDVVLLTTGDFVDGPDLRFVSGSMIIVRFLTSSFATWGDLISSINPAPIQPKRPFPNESLYQSFSSSPFVLATIGNSVFVFICKATLEDVFGDDLKFITPELGSITATWPSIFSSVPVLWILTTHDATKPFLPGEASTSNHTLPDLSFISEITVRSFGGCILASTFASTDGDILMLVAWYILTMVFD